VKSSLGNGPNEGGRTEKIFFICGAVRSMEMCGNARFFKKKRKKIEHNQQGRRRERRNLKTQIVSFCYYTPQNISVSYSKSGSK
jgi:hypothetical protein